MHICIYWFVLHTVFSVVSGKELTVWSTEHRSKGITTKYRKCYSTFHFISEILVSTGSWTCLSFLSVWCVLHGIMPSVQPGLPMLLWAYSFAITVFSVSLQYCLFVNAETKAIYSFLCCCILSTLILYSSNTVADPLLTRGLPFLLRLSLWASEFLIGARWRPLRESKQSKWYRSINQATECSIEFREALFGR